MKGETIMFVGLTGIISSAPVTNISGDLVFRLGAGDNLLYHDPEDMRFFRAMTTGNTVIMGRKTMDGLLRNGKTLPNRRVLILSHIPKTCDYKVYAESFGKIKEDRMYYLSLDSIMEDISLPYHIFDGKRIIHNFMAGGPNALCDMAPYMTGMFVSEFNDLPKGVDLDTIDKVIKIPESDIIEKRVLFEMKNFTISYYAFNTTMTAMKKHIYNAISAGIAPLLTATLIHISDVEYTLSMISSLNIELKLPKIETFDDLLYAESLFVSSALRVLRLIQANMEILKKDIISAFIIDMIRHVLAKTFAPIHEEISKTAETSDN